MTCTGDRVRGEPRARRPDAERMRSDSSIRNRSRCMLQRNTAEPSRLIHTACGQACGQSCVKPAQSQAQQGPQGLWRKNGQRKCLTGKRFSACRASTSASCMHDQFRHRVKLEFRSAMRLRAWPARLSTLPVDKPADSCVMNLAQARWHKARSKFGDKFAIRAHGRHRRMPFAHEDALAATKRDARSSDRMRTQKNIARRARRIASRALAARRRVYARYGTTAQPRAATRQ